MKVLSVAFVECQSRLGFASFLLFDKIQIRACLLLSGFTAPLMFYARHFAHVPGGRACGHVHVYDLSIIGTALRYAKLDCSLDGKAPDAPHCAPLHNITNRFGVFFLLHGQSS